MNFPIEPISKPSIFIASGGRTGALFLSRLLSQSVESIHSVFEPDLLHYWDFFKIGSLLAGKINDFGLFNMSLGKLLPRGNLRGLSLLRQKEQIDERTAALGLKRFRSKYISKFSEAVFAECNLQLAGLMDIIPTVFPNSKSVFIIRDGRHWVRSWLNWKQGIYGIKDFLPFLNSSRATAEMISGDPCNKEWRRFSQFQKIFWLWRFHIDYALKTVPRNPNAKIFRFEELFESENPRDSFNEFLNYVTCFPNGYTAHHTLAMEMLKKRFNVSIADNSPVWEDWPENRILQFQTICGPLHKRLDYGKENRWLEAVHKFDPQTPGS